MVWFRVLFGGFVDSTLVEVLGGGVVRMAGADEYLVKPLEFARLKETLESGQFTM